MHKCCMNVRWTDSYPVAIYRWIDSYPVGKKIGLGWIKAREVSWEGSKGNFRSNMAAVINRKAHAAILEGKVACPHKSCSKKPLFYQKSGFFYHYTIIMGLTFHLYFIFPQISHLRKHGLPRHNKPPKKRRETIFGRTL